MQVLNLPPFMNEEQQVNKIPVWTCTKCNQIQSIFYPVVMGKDELCISCWAEFLGKDSLLTPDAIAMILK